MVSVVRPLNQDVATDLLKKAIKTLAGNAARVEPLGLAVRAFGEISCPHDFLKVVQDFAVVPTLRSKIDYYESAQTLSFIVTSAAMSNSDDWIDAGVRKELSCDVIKSLHLVSAETRLCLVKCLVGLNNQTDAFGLMLSAEAITPNIQTFREKLKFLSHLSCPTEVTDDFVAEASLRFLLSNLSVNFSLLWDPVIKIIDTYFETMDQDKSWSIFYSIFHDINAAAVDVDVETEAVGKSDAGIDFKNFRNLLLRSLESLVPVVERKNAILATEFLEVFMKKKLDTRDGKGLAAFLGVYKQVPLALFILWKIKSLQFEVGERCYLLFHSMSGFNAI
jgi:hypothetical protein